MPAKFKVYVAAPFKTSDFVEIRATETIVCAHPEATGVKFCPVCGLPEGKRKSATRREHARRPDLSPFDDMDEADEKVGWFSEYLSESDAYGGEIGGLDIVDLNPDGWELGKRQWALGAEICSLDVDGCSSTEVMDPEVVASAAQVVRSKLHALGLDPSGVRLHFIGQSTY